MKFLKLFFSIFLLLSLGCASKKFDFLKFQNDLKNCERLSDVSDAYSRQNKFQSKKYIFIKTRIYIISKNIELIIPQGDSITEIIDYRNNIIFEFDKTNKLQTVAIQNNGIFDLKKKKIDNPIQFVITKESEKILIFDYKSNELYTIDKSMFNLD